MGASNFSELAYPKGESRYVPKEQKRRKVRTLDRSEKEKVRQRDQEACRVCFRRTRDVHERVFKSRGGVASLDNSLCVCRHCHGPLQEHAIQVYGPTCNGPLTFEMTEVVARLIFRGRATPSHVTVTRSKERD